MRLHTDVYRYFIVDALFMALNKQTKNNSKTIRGGLWAGGFLVQNSFYVHVPLTVLWGEAFYHDYYDYYSDY